jgi:hypothetical protein
LQCSEISKCAARVDCPTKYKALIVLEFILAACTNALIKRRR